eukprot:jgi/Botrbrau1/731/Bobra.160_2s0054.1
MQGVKHFKDITFTRGLTYGEMLLQNEFEWSCYNLDEADIAVQRQLYDLHVKEAERLLGKRLPIPAYGQLLKLSHTFNVLDARGAISGMERPGNFATMRSLARKVVGLWLERREELGFPLGEESPEPPAQAGQVAVPPEASAADFVMEVGTEELPPADSDAAVSQLRTAIPALLQRLRLLHGEIQVESTPRRLAVMVKDLASWQEDVEERVRGPPVKAAYGPDGQPSKALQGFCAKNGLEVASLTREADAKGVEYVWGLRKLAGRSAAQVLAEELGPCWAGISFGRSMRWNSG